MCKVRFFAKQTDGSRVSRFARRLRDCILVAGCAVLVAGPVPSLSAEPSDTNGTIVTSADADYKVWQVKTGTFISKNKLVSDLAGARLVILGEIHDRALHHAIRAGLVQDLLKVRRQQAPTAPPPAAVFEQGSTDRQPQLDALVQRYGEEGPAPTPQEFYDAMQWGKRGWPGGGIFDPLVKAVLKEKMPVFAGDVPRPTLMAVARSKVPGKADAAKAPLSDAELARLGLDTSLGDEQNKASLKEIEKAHCGVMPAKMLEPMAYAQRARDASLADVMINAAQQYGAAILFTGNGHARTDRGVPWYLRHRGQQNIVSVLINETEENPPDLAQNFAADYVIWTPPHKRPDPCAKLREKYGKTKR